MSGLFVFFLFFIRRFIILSFFFHLSVRFSFSSRNLVEKCQWNGLAKCIWFFSVFFNDFLLSNYVVYGNCQCISFIFFFFVLTHFSILAFYSIDRNHKLFNNWKREGNSLFHRIPHIWIDWIRIEVHLLVVKRVHEKSVHMLFFPFLGNKQMVIMRSSWRRINNNSLLVTLCINYDMFIEMFDCMLFVVYLWALKKKIYGRLCIWWE